jgi:hypothetical protein
LRQRLQHLENQVAMLRGELSQVQQQLTVMLASRGRGPTVGN